MWTQKAYFQLANYLSQYDHELLKQLLHQDPFEFNESSELLLQLFTKIQQRLNKTNAQNQLNVRRFIKQNQLLNNPIGLKNQVQQKLLEYLTENQCTQQFIQKASNLVNEKHYKHLIELIFPNASVILDRYQKIIKRFVLKQSDVLNILQLVHEGWLKEKIENPCNEKEENKYQYFEKSPEIQHFGQPSKDLINQQKPYSLKGHLYRPYQSYFNRYYDFY